MMQMLLSFLGQCPWDRKLETVGFSWEQIEKNLLIKSGFFFSGFQQQECTVSDDSASARMNPEKDTVLHGL